MREFLKGQSPLGLVLFFLVLAFGLLLRLTNLAAVSAWGDELATLYYVKNFDFIFPYESHTPLYYGLCKLWSLVFPASVFSFRILFVSLSLLLALGMTALAHRRRGASWALLFFVLWWCWPTDVTYSRHARHYGLILELTMLLLLAWDQRAALPRWGRWAGLAVYQFLYPFLIFPVFLLTLFDLLRKKLHPRAALFDLSAAAPLLAYYLAKYVSFGAEKVESNISWVRTTRQVFFETTINLFAGEVQPFFAIYQLTPFKSLGFLFLIFAIFFLRWPLEWRRLRSSESVLCGVAFLAALLFEEVVSAAVTNVRVPRYFIFLVPFLLLFFLSLGRPEEKPALLRPALLFLCLMVFHVGILRPWRNVLWDDQTVAYFKSLPKAPGHAVVVCGNPFQLDYYFQTPTYVCKDRALELLEARRPFYLLDINGNDKGLVLYLLEEAEVLEFRNISHGTFLHVTPKGEGP